jgi:cytochrome c5
MQSRGSSIWFRTMILSVACVAFLGAAFPASSEDTKTNAVPVEKPSTHKHQLSGAELYSIHCNRCHPERYPTERTAAQWKTILLHMRVRANLPAEQARTILKYLQENSGR